MSPGFTQRDGSSNSSSGFSTGKMSLSPKSNVMEEKIQKNEEFYQRLVQMYCNRSRKYDRSQRKRQRRDTKKKVNVPNSSRCTVIGDSDVLASEFLYPPTPKSVFYEMDTDDNASTISSCSSNITSVSRQAPPPSPGIEPSYIDNLWAKKLKQLPMIPMSVDELLPKSPTNSIVKTNGALLNKIHAKLEDRRKEYRAIKRATTSSGFSTNSDDLQPNGTKVTAAKKVICANYESPLPNDSCDMTRENERMFAHDQTLQTYKFRFMYVCGVLHSRTMNRQLEWPEDRPLMSSDLEGYFNETGHTLTLDYEHMYVRCMAFDIDCMCRTIDGISHLNESKVTKVVNQMLVVCARLGMDMGNVNISIWRQSCGFHVYTDVTVSMCLHLLISKLLNSEFSSETFIIEVPKYMPIPYSAKKLTCLYKPLLPESPPITIIPIMQGVHFLEIGRFCKGAIDDYTMFHVQRSDCTETFNKQESVFRETQPINLANIRMYNICSPQYEQVKMYIQNVIREIVAITRITAIDLPYIISDDIRNALFSFFQKFNAVFGANNRGNDVGPFIQMSLIENASQDLQHFVVMLNKFLNISQERMRTEVLPYVYKTALDSHDVCVKRFIDSYDEKTYNAYNSSSFQQMFDYYTYLYVNNLSTLMSISEKLQRMVQNITKCSTNLEYCESWPKDKGKLRELKMTHINAYAEALVKLGAIIIDSGNNKYVLVKTTYIDANNIQIIIANIGAYMLSWLDNTNNSNNMRLQSSLNIYNDEMLRIPVYTNVHYMISTSKGVFNSLTGMYSSHSPFLRFHVSQNVSLWRYNIHQEIMHDHLNYQILERIDLTERFFNVLKDQVFDLFVHYIFAPMIITLHKINNVSEYNIQTIFNLLKRYTCLKPAHFLINYYPIDLRFMAVIIHIFEREGAFFDQFTTLCTRVLMGRDFNSKEVWRTEYRQAYESVSENLINDTTKSYQEKLYTLHHTDEICFLAFIYAILITKCSSFQPFTSAFDITELPSSQYVHPGYPKEFDIIPTAENCRENLIRASKIVLGIDYVNPPTEDWLMVETIFSICASMNFDPIGVIDLLRSLSLIFTPYNYLKKIVLFYGLKNTGKSFFCKQLQDMVYPAFCSFANVEKANERAEVTLKHSVTILAEVSKVDAPMLKTITGNDTISVSKFYEQTYKPMFSQSLMFGATNNIVRLTKTNNGCDYATVSRFYIIHMQGQFIHATDTRANLLDLLTHKETYIGTIEHTNITNELSYLVYWSYLVYRDNNLYPTINEQNSDNIKYRNNLYTTNNIMHKFMTNIGVERFEGLEMSSARLRELIEKNYTLATQTYMFKNKSDIYSNFQQTYECDLIHSKFVPNLQETNLIKHIYEVMSIRVYPDGYINQDDRRNQLNMFVSSTHKDLADLIFQRQNTKYYDQKRDVYVGIIFAQSPAPYEEFPDIFDENYTNSNDNGQIIKPFQDSGISTTVHNDDQDVPYNRPLDRNDKTFAISYQL